MFVAGLRYSLFVRKIYYTVDLYAHVTQPQGAPLPGEITNPRSYFFFARCARAENLRNGVTWGRKSARGCNVTPPENLFCPESVYPSYSRFCRLALQISDFYRPAINCKEGAHRTGVLRASHVSSAPVADVSSNQRALRYCFPLK